MPDSNATSLPGAGGAAPTQGPGPAGARPGGGEAANSMELIVPSLPVNAALCRVAVAADWCRLLPGGHGQARRDPPHLRRPGGAQRRPAL
jgi:hypothetical protein